MSNFEHLRPLADRVAFELIIETDPAEIVRVVGFNDVDNLVGALSRIGFDAVATDLWNAAHKETNA